MKISLNWIFDHIKGDLSDVDVPALVEKFIKTTAEIEGWRKVEIATDPLTLAQVVAFEDEAVIVHSLERGQKYVLPQRADAIMGSWFMIIDSGAEPRWATSLVFGGIKDMMLPAIHCPENMRNGSWKEALESKDYIIEIDNKSINSRPDLWGHRGLAREIAAILDLPLRPLSDFIIEKESTTDSKDNNSFSIVIKAPDACDRFAALYLSSVGTQPSSIDMMIRLSRLDSRSIDFLVDATNYVMFDLGQPMHAFDADTFPTQELCVAYAKNKEKLALLDGESIELTAQDLVITDGNMPLSLAGIMGGVCTGISTRTRSILLEAAHFDPVVVRRTAARHKKRTESSIRFEKNIDPHQNVDAIKRYLFLLDRAKISYTAGAKIISLGIVPQKKIIMMRHAFIERCLGIIMDPELIVDILTKLEFGVEQSVEDDTILYTVTVPSFRATKDIKIAEDIVEEIGRYVGYDVIPRVMPALPLRPNDLHNTYTIRAIKGFLSYGLEMRELYGYSFFDESFLRELNWQPQSSIDIKNPISENYTRLVTTLQPQLLKAIGENSIAQAQLRFYEWGRVWHMSDENILEQKSLSGVFFDHSGIDFYTGKGLLSRMFDALHINVSWKSIEDNVFNWYSCHQAAEIVHEGISIGIAGMVDQAVVNMLSPAGGSTFIFEINGDYLLQYRKPLKRFIPLSKYPSVRRDISMMIGISITTDALVEIIKTSDHRIRDVILIDFFSKPEWKDRKAMTFHMDIEDKEKTLTSQEVDTICSHVITQLQGLGATIR